MPTAIETAKSDNRPFLLLTAAIDARNGADCLFSKEQRLRQYLHAFRFYIRFLRRNQDICKGIVFCENSEADLSPFEKTVPADLRSKVEFVALSKDGFLPAKGKSYNEMRTLDIAMDVSTMLGPDDLFLKLTGRYPIHNIRRLVRDAAARNQPISVCYFRWPGVKRFGSPHPPLCDTRCIAIRKSTWNANFRDLYKSADNAKHRHFENIVLEVVDKHAGAPGWVQGFSRPPLILGKQGGTKRIAGIAVPKIVEPVLLLATYLIHWKTMRRQG